MVQALELELAAMTDLVQQGSTAEEFWEKLRELKPRLRSHVAISKHHYRNEAWYILEDSLTGKFHRFTPDAHRVIGLMNGRLSLDEIYRELAQGESPPEKEHIAYVLRQLLQADLLQSDATANTDEMLRRFELRRKLSRNALVKSPLFLKFPLIDPEKFVDRFKSSVCPVFSTPGFIGWLLVVMTGLVLAVMHWVDLTENIIDRTLSAQNIFLLWLVYPLVKFFHEFGHAFAVKRWGGEVHEMGIMLLVFMPVPYVDASAASAFEEKGRRMVVGAAGIFVELFLASLAMIAWLNLEPGILRAAAFNTMVIAGISTLLFNGNPLLRFDGYYIFADFVEMPNLAQRSNHYLQYLLRKHILRVPGEDVFPEPLRDRVLLATYAVASFCYRMLIIFGIILLVAGKFFVFGVVLAVWAFTGTFGVALYKFIKYLATSPGLGDSRPKTIAIAVSLMTMVIACLFLIPMPSWTRADGVIWMPPDSIVRTGTGCFLAETVAVPGQQVAAGDILLRCANPDLDLDMKLNQGDVSQLELELAASFDNRVEADLIREELNSARAQLAYTEEAIAKLAIRSPRAGTFVMPNAQDRLNNWYNQGQEIAYVIVANSLLARVVVPQRDISSVRQNTQAIELQLSSLVGRIFTARIVREIPQATDRLPSAALTMEGGGNIAIAANAEGEATAFERYFQFDLQFMENLPVERLGERVYVRFEHGSSPLGLQWARDLRLLFLDRFNI